MSEVIGNRSNRLPLILRVLIRISTYLVAWFFIGFVAAVAKHWFGAEHIELIAAYRGGADMLLAMWFCGVFRKAAPEFVGERLGRG